MKSISVIINEYSKRSIELKDEYKVDEFINFFEKEIRLLKNYRSGSSTASATKEGTHTQATSSNAAELTDADC